MNEPQMKAYEALNRLTGYKTPAELDELRKEAPDGIFCLHDKTGIGYFKEPNRHDINAALSKLDSEAPLDMFEELYGLLFIGGDDSFPSKPSRFFGVVQQLKKKMDGDSVKLVNL